jgi:hypothetical protein
LEFAQESANAWVARRETSCKRHRKTIRQLGAFSIDKRQEVARVVLADIARTQKELEEITDKSKAVNIILAQGDRGNQSRRPDTIKG